MRPERDSQHGLLPAEAHRFAVAEQVRGSVMQWGYRNGVRKPPQQLGQIEWLFAL